jgi:hypothetical protein
MSIAEPRDLMAVLKRLEQQRHVSADVESQRRFRRFNVRADGLLEAVDMSGDKPFPVMLRDISRGGVGFLSDRFLEPTSMWRIRLVHRGMIMGGQPLLVRYCRLIQSDLYIVGGQFVAEPSLLSAAGVSDEDIKASEPWCRYDRMDVSEFVPPEEG